MKTGKMVVLLAALVLFFGAWSAPAATIIVNPGDSIQVAIDAAPNGSTIKIKAGTYTGEITIGYRSRLKLIGAGAGKTIIDGSSGAGDVVTITNSKKITLQRCTITNGVGNNISIDNSHWVKILLNTITHAASYGIVGMGTNLVIQSNQVQANVGFGIGVIGYRNLIIKNTVTGNDAGILDAGNGDKIIRNTVRNNTGNGIIIAGASVKTQRNTVTDNGGLGIVESLGSAQQNVYTSNIVQRNAGGIYVHADAMVIKNTVTNNAGDGIDGGWSGNTLIGNIIKDNTGYGIYLVRDGHFLKGNLVTGNGGAGIYIDATDGGTLTDLTGMNQILKNKVLNNGVNGIELDGCNLTIVSNNFCAGNGWGISGGTDSIAVIYTKNKVNNNLGGLAMTANGGLDYVARNIVANNLFDGVDANGGQRMTFEKNVIIGNKYGLADFDASLVSRNKILNNTGNGIDASSGSASLIEKNVVKGNGDGTATFDLYDSPSPTDDWWQKNQYLTESL